MSVSKFEPVLIMKSEQYMIRDAQKDIFVTVMKHVLIHCIVVSYSSTISN